MSRDIDDLIPEFRSKVEALIYQCKKSNYPMRPFFTLRTPFEQARLWRQSRTITEINEKIEDLKKNRAAFLAYCIESVGPQNGPRVTRAIPGMSWHQWGEAIDCFWLVEDKAEWSTRRKINGINGYENYAAIAKALELSPGGYWSSLKDWPHVQLKPISSPLKRYSLIEIDERMEVRFSEFS